MTRLLIVLTLLLWHQPARARCRVVAQQAFLEQVQVKVPGHEPFSLTLDRVPVVVRPGSAKTAALQVQAPLRFAVPSYPAGKIRFRVAGKTALYGGRLTLAAGLAPALVAVRGRSIQVKLPLGGLKLKRGNVEIPCGALTVASDKTHYEHPTLVQPAKGAAVYGTTEPIPLYRGPRKVDPLWVELGALLTPLQRRPGWLRLQLRWSDGSSVQGWVPAERVEANPELLFGLGAGPVGLGEGACGRSHRPRLVPFTVRRGAAIAAGPGGPVWARMARTQEVSAFTITRADGWVRIGKLEGLPPKPCSEHDRLWVHVRDIVWKQSAR